MRLKLAMTMPLRALVATALFGLVGCDLDVPDLNNPGLEELEENPTPALVGSASTGLIIQNRFGISAQAGGGYVSLLGILGRESYTFDRADPRSVGEMLVGQLSPNSPFGGAHWGVPYTAIRAANIILRAVPRTPGLSAEQQSATAGFAHTMQALALLRIIVTRDDIGAVINADHEIGELGEIVSRDEVYAEIGRLLDVAVEELKNGGAEFPFALNNGFDGFDTPSSFIQFNRALAARAAAYRGSLLLDAGHSCSGDCATSYDRVLTVLGNSFISPEAMPPASLGDLDRGVYYSFSTSPGDVTNGLISPNIFVHPSVREDVQPNDVRFTRKVRPVAGDDTDPPGSDASGLESNLKFRMYTSPNSSVPLIRNEELILLRAEANWALGNPLTAAIGDLNLVRDVSGDLPALDAGLSRGQVEDEILYNRRYSLLFEGGHRWIDTRRFGRTDEIPLDLPDHGLNIRFPLPQAECDGRPGEPKCEMGSR